MVSTILVTGGSGTFGSHAVRMLAERDHDVRVLSRRPGGGTHVGDLATGEGVAEAAAGAELILHAASNTRGLGKGDIEQTRNLLAAARDCRHLLYVSIVGIDRIPYRYYKRKLACEREIERGGAPYTILRATQFHELAALVFQQLERLPLAPVPLRFRGQTVAAAEAATRAADLLAGAPHGMAPDFGGPAVLTVGEMLGEWRAQRGRPRRVLNLPLPGRVARGFREGRNTCPEHTDGTQTWAEFLAA